MIKEGGAGAEKTGSVDIIATVPSFTDAERCLRHFIVVEGRRAPTPRRLSATTQNASPFRTLSEAHIRDCARLYGVYRTATCISISALRALLGFALLFSPLPLVSCVD